MAEHVVDDDRLMSLVADGDEEAFRLLMDRHAKGVLNFFLRMGAYIDDAEDMMQTTFMKVYEYRCRYEGKGHFRAFLYTLARHTWVEFVRRNSRRVSTVPIENVTDVSGGEDPASSVQRKLDVQQALQKLPEKHREVIVMNVYQGLTHKEIASILGIPEGTVKSRSFAAMRMLREMLSDE